MTKTRICLWSSPRNISTAMMYSFAQRPDTVVFDEPLYAFYLSHSGSDHPGREEILLSQEQKGEKVIRQLLLKDHGKPVSFFKQMTHHLCGLDFGFLSEFKNIIFIRDPKQIISSYAVVRPDVTMDDIGIKMQWDLFTYLNKHGLSNIVLDSNEILKASKQVLSTLCERLEIPFYEQMLSWPPGPKKEDGVWATYWYDNVHRSTGFEKQSTSTRPLPANLLPLYEECKEYYEKLFVHSIKA